MGSTPIRWVCGKCRKTDQHFVTQNSPEPEVLEGKRDSTHGTQVQYRCRTCGFVGWSHHRIARWQHEKKFPKAYS